MYWIRGAKEATDLKGECAMVALVLRKEEAVIWEVCICVCSNVFIFWEAEFTLALQ